MSEFVTDDILPEVEFVGSIPPAIAAALVQAQKAAKAVAKSAEGMSYKYTKMEDLFVEGRAALNGAGLAVIPGNLDILRFEVGDKKVVNYTAVRMWVVVHEGGDALNVRVCWPLYLQSGKRSRDKAVAVADTTMLGYLYRDLLGIPRLGEEQMDARDDRGTTEPGIAKDEPGPRARRESGPKKPPSPKKKKKPATKKAATKPAPKPKPEPDPDEPEAAPVDSSPEMGTGEGGTTKRGKTKAGQAYGEKADQVAKDQRAELDEGARDEEIRRALAMGITPSTTNNQLIVELPPDPTADDLEAAEWPEELAAELVGYPETEPVKRDALNVITRKAAELLGLSFKDAKPMMIPAFLGLGVDLKKKQVPNGYQLRLWCMTVAGLSKAHAAETSAA